ncbi:hypothetical protein H0H92_008056, partial [Tricholoma furcatifolium]
MYNATWFVHVVDRQGKITLGPFTYADHTKEFVFIILYLTTAGAQNIGLDTTMRRVVTKKGQGDEFFTKFDNAGFSPVFKKRPQDEGEEEEEDGGKGKGKGKGKGEEKGKGKGEGEDKGEDEGEDKGEVEDEDEDDNDGDYGKRTKPKKAKSNSGKMGKGKGKGKKAKNKGKKGNEKHKKGEGEDNAMEGERAADGGPAAAEIAAQEAEFMEKNFPASNIAQILCQSKWYSVKKELFRTQGLFGRGTRVWSVTYPSRRTGEQEEAILKDSWPLATLAAESVILSKIPQSTFLPKLVSSQEELGTTSTRRAQGLFAPTINSSTGRPLKRGQENDVAKRLLEAQAAARVKRRLLSSPVGVLLSEAKSLIELVGVFLDITKAIKLLQKNGIMHRGISYHNILIRAKPVEKHELDDEGSDDRGKKVAAIREDRKCRSGFVIDVEYAGLITDNEATPTQAIDVTNPLTTPASSAGPSRHAGSNVSPPPSYSAYPERQSLWMAGLDAQAPGSSSLADPHAMDVSTSSRPDAPTASGLVEGLGNVAEEGIRTGTAPFMALPLLLHASPHRVAYDLESLFYVLVYVCTNYEKLDPPVVRERGLLSASSRYAPISAWFQALPFRDLGCLKFTQLHFNMEGFVLEYVSKYFHPLRDALRKLWIALYPSIVSSNRGDIPPGLICVMEKKIEPNEACDKFITIFQDTILVLASQQQMPPPPLPTQQQQPRMPPPPLPTQRQMVLTRSRSRPPQDPEPRPKRARL